MSDKKGNVNKKVVVPKVEIDPADDALEVEEERVAEEQKVKKASVVSADSGAYSQDDPSGSKERVEKDVKDAGSSKTPKVELGEGSNQLAPESSPSKSKRSKSPIQIIKDKAQSIAKGLKTVLTMSPSKKSGLIDAIEVEHERPKPKSSTKEPKMKRKSLKLSEMYDETDTESETSESAATTTSNVPASDDTSVDEKSDNLDDCEAKDDTDDSVEDSKK